MYGDAIKLICERQFRKKKSFSTLHIIIFRMFDKLTKVPTREIFCLCDYFNRERPKRNTVNHNQLTFIIIIN